MFHLLFVVLGVPMSLPEGECCRVEGLPEPVPARVVVVLPAVDARRGHGGDRAVGVVRNQFGAPRLVKPPEPLADAVTEGLAERLRERGHEVRVAEGWPAGEALEAEALRDRFGASVVIVQPTIERFSVDVSDARSWRADADLSLRVVDEGDTTRAAQVRIARGDGGAGVPSELRDRAWEWYGREGDRWAVTAAYELTLIDTADALVDALDGGGARAVAWSP